MVIGVDIGGTNTKIGLVNGERGILKTSSVKTAFFTELEDYIETLAAEIQKLAENEVLEAIGIGAPNGNGLSHTINFAPNLPWKGVIPLADMLQKIMGVPCFLINDASAAALGEKRFGVASEYEDFVEITIGTGLGSGFIVNGKIVNGHDGMAGEVGHMRCIEKERKCSCGRMGCLETYVSKRGIIETYKEINQGKNDIESVTTLSVMARDGDHEALLTFERTGEILGKALSDVMVITSPEAFVFFGGIVKNHELFLSFAKKAFEENCLNVYKGKVKFEVSGLMDKNAAILGAAALAKSKL